MRCSWHRFRPQLKKVIIVELSKQENIGLWVGVISTVMPGLIVAGFFPDFNVLPTWVWMLIATVGAMLAGLVSAKRKFFGAMTGGIAGLGVIVGIVGYLAIRTAVLPSENFLRFEIAIGALIGAAPGLIAYCKLARNDPSNQLAN
jgi:hypothetical protein